MQVLQPFSQLLDVDLDLHPRPGLRWEPSPMSSSTSLPVPLPPAKPSLPSSSELGMVPWGSYVHSLPDPQAPKARGFLQPSHGSAWPQQEALSQAQDRTAPGEVGSGRAHQGGGGYGRAWGELLRSCHTPGTLGNFRSSLSWGVLGACAGMGSRRQLVTSASVTTFFLNKRSSSSSDEHLGLGSRKALASGTHPASHTFGKSFLGVGVGMGAMLGRQGL